MPKHTVFKEANAPGQDVWGGHCGGKACAHLQPKASRVARDKKDAAKHQGSKEPKDGPI